MARSLHTASSMARLMMPRSSSALRQTSRAAPIQTCLRSSPLNQSTSSRAFSTTQRRQKKTVEQVQSYNRVGPFSLYSAGFFVLCGFGLYYYFTSEKDRLNRKRVRDASKGYGKPRIGGEFELIDQHGKKFGSEDMKGKFALVYFGFSHCPDICPDELDKMARMIDTIKLKRGNVLRPVIITCDPARDSPAVLEKYLSEFHEDMIGLTGSWDDIRKTCKLYRVYFSTPPHVKQGQDYLVDHSIYFYLMDPDGDFIEVVGRQHTAEQGAKLVTDHIDKSLGRQVTPDSWQEVKITDLAVDGRGWFGGKKVEYKPNLE